ncbi:MAG: hypothetical protein ACLFP1_04060 [Candidatus Goldiibacteriota bacterium]
MTYECVVKKGHTGAGKHFEEKIYINAANFLDAMNIAKRKGSVKKGRSCNSGQAVLSIKLVN